MKKDRAKRDAYTGVRADRHVVKYGNFIIAT